MTRKSEPILVVGGGLGGAAVSLALARKGFRVTLIEQAPEFGVIGYGIQLGPNVFSMFDRLGVSDAVLAQSIVPKAVLMIDSVDAGVIARIPTGASFAARFKRPYIVIHRVDPAALGVRDLTVSPSAKLAADKAGVANGNVDVAEIHAPFTHQELILRTALGLDPSVKINPSGGALAANPMFSTGLERIGFAARHIFDGSAQRVLAHATSGAALQQNLVAVMEGGN